MREEIRTEPVVAWRAWSMIKPNFLCSPGTVWMPRQPLEACCSAEHRGSWQDSPRHLVSPDAHCTCGIYSVKTEQELSNYFSIGLMKTGPPVVGRLKIWGKIVEHDAGYRSQFAYPAQLHVLAEEWKPFAPIISDAYGVPVDVGLPRDFPPPAMDRYKGQVPFGPPPAPSCPTPTHGHTQYSVLRSELKKLFLLAEDRNLVGQIARVVVENLDDEYSVKSRDLFDALVAAKLDGRVRTNHPWLAFELRKRSFNFLSRHYRDDA